MELRYKIEQAHRSSIWGFLTKYPIFFHSDPVFSSGFVRREFNDSGIADGKLRTISTSSCATTMSSESYRISLGVGPLWWS